MLPRLKSNTVLYIILSIIALIIIYMISITKVIKLEYEDVDDVLLDERPVPSKAEIFKGIQREIPSLPIDFWKRHRNEVLQLNESCAFYPHILDLQYHNTYWQIFSTRNLKYYLYGAYYDNRPRIALNGTRFVRILALVNQIEKKFPLIYCQMWFDQSRKPVIVPVKEHLDTWMFVWNENKENLGNLSYPVLITCEVPKTHIKLEPKTISLVAEQCDNASNNLKVTFDRVRAEKKETRGTFAVCVKAMWFSYTDESARLVEWLEMLRLLGAEKVIIYNLQTHPNNTRVLEYYHRQGFVDYPSYTMGRGEPNTPSFSHLIIKEDLDNHRLNQMIQLNDCLYRNMYRYKYLALIDIDELIMPLGNLTTWHDLLAVAQNLEKPKSCSSCYCFRNVYFPRYSGNVAFTNENLKYMYMLHHLRRVRKHLAFKLAPKCIHDTDSVIAIHNHYPRIAVNNCLHNYMDLKYGQLQHYREPDIASDLENPVIDDNILRFRLTLVERSIKVFNELGFYRKIKEKFYSN